ncbi:unnamed protein product [Arctia plantaginis]|uniref:Uncharacterized protein n=1 Tax=Arctia plantaginis TaxID=874455 RepID=A0A8S0ZDF1_ARCPL|nr:unnamed protein product [Arctia plantaginis]
MNTTHEDAVLSFDLDFLHPTANNIPVQALKQRYIGQIKKRIIRVDALNSHYNSLKLDLCSKNKELDLIKKKLESTNQEHTQTSLEYKEILENFSKCEMECQNLKTAINNYQEKYYDAENRVQAGKSHVVQLQQLVKEYEGKIDSLQQNERRNNEKALRESIEKELLQWKKKYKKEIGEWRTKYETLRKQIQEIKTGTGKLNKQSAPKSEKISSKIICDSITHDDNSENEDEVSLDYTSQCDTQDSLHNKIENTPSSTTNKNNTPMEVDSDYKIERVSVDTGCGSSLASSDNEKWLNSPDYYFSPINGEGVDKIRSSKLVDIATSPVLPVKVSEIATSPIPSVVMVNMAISPIPSVVMVNVAISPIPSVVMANVATSPINIQSETCKESEHQTELNINNVDLTEPNNNIVVTEVHCPVQIIENAPHSVIHEKRSETIVQHITDIDLREKRAKDYLQLNSSNNLEVDYNTDREIEMILSKMRLDHELITPIPKTPKKIGMKSAASQTHHDQAEYLSHCTCADSAIAKNVSEAAREDAAQAKEDIAKTKKSQKVLISNLAKVMKEMFYIKSFLKSRFSAPGTALEHLNDSTPEKDLFENVSGVNFNYDYHNLFESANLSDNSIKQTESVKLPTSSKLAPESLITVISEQIIKPANIDHLREKQVANEILAHPVQEIVSEKCIKQNGSPKRIDSVMCLNSSAEKETVSPTKVAKGRSVRKLTNLAKYRNKCEVRNYKIRRETPPLKKLHIKPKQVPCHDVKKVTKNDTSATLNDEQVYAKAVKVMAELNAVPTKDSVDTVLTTKIQQKITAVNEHHSAAECKTDLKSGSTQPIFSSGFTSPIPKIISPIPETTPPTISRRRSIRSSKLIDPSPNIASTSPDLTITSSIPVLRSPKPTIVSSTPTKRSPSLVTSSPTTSITSPRRSSRLLEFAAISPKSTVTLPKSHNVSKRLFMSSSPPTITSPKLGTAPSITADTSKNVGKFETTLPDQNSVLLTPTITLPKLGKAPPITAGISKSADNFETTLTNQNSLLLTPTITSPKLRKEPPITAGINKNDGIYFETTLPKQNSILLQKDLSINRPVQSAERKRKLSNSSDIQSKRVLRSSVSQSFNTKEHDESYKEVSPAGISAQEDISCHPKESILCSMIEKYGISKVRPVVRHIPDAVLKNVNSNIEQYMSRILEGPINKDNAMMIELVEECKTYDYKIFVAGLTKYLTNPERKIELFGKIASPPAPQMTKSEAVLLFVIRQLRTQWRPVDTVETLLSSLEHTLFKLNRTPEFEVIESVSHFYALLCRYFGLQSRLKVFMLDAMYCILYKSAPLIKECLEVWPHIIPLAHMTAAKTPLITIFVYLLHFYKCEDRFSRVQDIRNILQRKYSYQVTEWNEGKILELVGNSISELRDIPCEKKMLRIAIIILAKRNGPKWTQNNIIKRLFQFIEKESLPEHIITFCVSLIGPLIKPYPIDMKVHCEIALNQLLNVLNTIASKRTKEASISSMLIMSRHNAQRVNEILLSRKMEIMSPELAELFRIYIRMKPLNTWLKNLSRPSNSN